MNPLPTKTRITFVHVPLGRGPLGEAWCLELAADHAASAPVLVLLTTQHPALLEHIGWTTHLAATLRVAIDAASAGGIQPLQHCWRIVKRHAKTDRAVSRRLEALLRSVVPPDLRRQLERRGASVSGRRRDPKTFERYDDVARLTTMDDLIAKGYEVYEGSKRRVLTYSDLKRGAEAIGQRFKLEVEAALEHPALRPLLELVRRVRKVAVPLPYVLVGCIQHDRAAVVPGQTPDAWAGTDVRLASEIERARTVTLRSRIAAPSRDLRLPGWRADWLTVWGATNEATAPAQRERP